MILISKDMIGLSKKMLDIYKNYEINLTLIAYSDLDREGVLNGYKVFLSENKIERKKCTYLINWISGYHQFSINLFSGQMLYTEYSRFENEVKTQRLIEMYGKEAVEKNKDDWEDDDFCDLLECDYDVSTIRNMAIRKAVIYFMDEMQKYILENMKDEKIDNKVYSRDKNNDPLAVDKGFIEMIDDSGRTLAQITYNDELENDKAAILCKKLYVEEDIFVQNSVMENWIKESRSITEPKKVLETQTVCNDEEEDCSLDLVRIYMLSDGTYKVHRQHMY